MYGISLPVYDNYGYGEAEVKSDFLYCGLKHGKRLRIRK